MTNLSSRRAAPLPLVITPEGTPHRRADLEAVSLPSYHPLPFISLASSTYRYLVISPCQVRELQAQLDDLNEKHATLQHEHTTLQVPS